jgi:hypothetical protein
MVVSDQRWWHFAHSVSVIAMRRAIADAVDPSVLWSTPRTTWSFWAIFMRTSVPLCFCAPSVVIGLGGYPLFLTVDASYLSALLLCVPVYWPVSWGSAIVLPLGLFFKSHVLYTPCRMQRVCSTSGQWVIPPRTSAGGVHCG